MRSVVWLLTLGAGACALGWICGVRWCDVGFVAAVAVALLLAPGEPRRAA